MPDFNVRSDSVNVEQIMEQIRARIREKRGVDYTEQQIRELAAVKLEKFLDPRGVRSDLLNEFRRVEPDPNFSFEDDTLFHSTRAPFLRWIRQLLRPILKVFFNPNPLIHALHIQSRLNDLNASRHQLYYELIHNLVVETTRLGIEVKTLKMRVESLDARVDFSERRARALEGVVMYRPQVEYQDDAVKVASPDRGSSRATGSAGPVSQAGQMSPGGSGGVAGPGPGPTAESPGQRSRRRRRRRGRRGGAPATSIMGSPAGSSQGSMLSGPSSAPDAPQSGGPAPASDSGSAGEAPGPASSPSSGPGPSPGSGHGGSDDEQ